MAAHTCTDQPRHTRSVPTTGRIPLVIQLMSAHRWLRVVVERETGGGYGECDTAGPAACDRDPLSRFVRRALTTDEQERANLNYWAYWVGEIDTIHVDDDFMIRTDPRTWTGTRLLSHLLARLQLDSAHTELNIHTLWALLLTHPD